MVMRFAISVVVSHLIPSANLLQAVRQGQQSGEQVVGRERELLTRREQKHGRGFR